MLELFSVFIIGCIGSLHCLGMCGPFILAYSLHIKGHETHRTGPASNWCEGSLLHHLLFHSGRLLSYGFIGALAAGLFKRVGEFRLTGLFTDLRTEVTLAGGSLMVFLGFVVLKILPLPGFFISFFSDNPSFQKRLLPLLFRSQRLGSRIAMGVVAGFFPCGLLWSMIVKAATADSVAGGFLTMLSFGLGTVPALYLVGFSASLFSLKMRMIGEKIAAASIIAMGLILIVKGVRTLV